MSGGRLMAVRRRSVRGMGFFAIDRVTDDAGRFPNAS
jgi:hypothetical protein